MNTKQIVLGSIEIAEKVFNLYLDSKHKRIYATHGNNHEEEAFLDIKYLTEAFRDKIPLSWSLNAVAIVEGYRRASELKLIL